MRGIDTWALWASWNDHLSLGLHLSFVDLSRYPRCDLSGYLVLYDTWVAWPEVFTLSVFLCYFRRHDAGFWAARLAIFADAG